jgi:hypothetical protein
MTILRSLGSLVALGVFISCATPLERARNVRMKNSDPPKECEQVGALVISRLSAEEKEEETKARMEERAIAKGGNYIRLDSISEKGALSGVAFRCP